jgi:uncharacterized protein with NRDE domain
MCLLVLGWRAVPDQQLVLVANRDELHARPTAAMHWWPEPALLGGRDLSAGGTWLGVDARGRFGAITNFRGGPDPAAPPSRGTLIPRFLAGEDSPAQFLSALAGEAERYAGFSLLLGDAHTLGYFCNREPAPPRLLPPGVYGLSNATLDAPWPKLLRSRARLAAQLARAGATEELFTVLDDRAVATDAELPDTGVGLALERRLSAPFIVDPHYGTRSTSVLTLAATGGGSAHERSFAADGSPLGTAHFAFAAPPRRA